MPIMIWDKSLDIGVEAMNEDHREILSAMNEIYDAHTAGRPGTAINRLVSRLGDVCVHHFADEEKYMLSINFPGLVNHKLIHEKLLTTYAKHAADIKAAGGKANDAFFHFLRHWLSSHIRGIDTKYAEHAHAVPAR